MRRYVLGKSELCSRNFGFVGLVWAVNVMAKHWQAPGGAAGLLLAYPLWKTKCRIPCATVNLQTAVVFNRIRIADIYCPPFKESACSRWRMQMEQHAFHMLPPPGCNSSNAWGGKYLTCGDTSKRRGLFSLFCFEIRSRGHCSRMEIVEMCLCPDARPTSITLSGKH